MVKVVIMDPKLIKSAAYHEAGHVTAAVVQAMPLQTAGMYVDLNACGVANYFDRPESDIAMTERDHIERKRTIIALYAGPSAQLRFYPGTDKQYWTKDLIRIGTLSRQLHFDNELAQIAARKDLRGRAEKLIDKFWPVVEELAMALLAKPCVPMPAEESAVRWGTGQVRNLPGHEIADCFSKHGIKTTVLEPGTPRYESLLAEPHYDSLA